MLSALGEYKQSFYLGARRIRERACISPVVKNQIVQLNFCFAKILSNIQKSNFKLSKTAGKSNAERAIGMAGRVAKDVRTARTEAADIHEPAIRSTARCPGIHVFQ